MCVCVLQYEYELDDRGNRILLGKGTYGSVFGAIDTDHQVKIAIKEIPERISECVSHVTSACR